MRRTNTAICRANRGFMLIAVIVVLTLAMTLFGLWARAAIQQHRWLEGETLRMQAMRLAESGVARAMSRHANESDYRDEIWAISAPDLQSRNAAEVRIRVETIGDELHVDVTADFPAGTVRRARVSKRIEILNPISGNKS